jgi:hypothetical protein
LFARHITHTDGFNPYTQNAQNLPLLLPIHINICCCNLPFARTILFERGTKLVVIPIKKKTKTKTRISFEKKGE